MDTLKERIYKDGIIIGDNILKVDSFINHQIDTKLVDDLGKYFATKFKGVNKVLTIETSGIAFAIGVANHFDFCPLVFAKKSGSATLDTSNVYQTSVASFTKKVVNNVYVDKRFISKGDKILIIDDFLAEGNALLGLIDICKQAEAEVVGCGIIIEKGFQAGRKKVESLGIRVESAAIVDHFENGKVILK
ncbi:MAG: xanthine phosphoribosyltransferase [Bacillales bacterium]|nr:xanthine phosphoribosyltransferase [Bacillales bacterium]